ncbi:MAG: MBL fold metallo-hydrolase [Deltaproteobacteria bacterium]|nr:MBL fold metallo-hydrolase [Deltaproteobacteria bacterium]
MSLKKIFIFIGCLVATSAFAQQDFSKVQIKTIPVADGVYMLAGRGGNIGLFVGQDGAFLIDDQYAPLTDKILEAISAVTDKPVRFLVNTHWHGDHTGGNENIGKGGTIIVAHDNVRKRLAKGQFMKVFNANISPAPPKALPVITFADGVTFHWNNETLEVVHSKSAHTDGDAVVYFKSANVVHVGDLFFNGIYPFIDAGSGGSLEGVIAGVDEVLGRIDDNTKVIPGHGPLGSKTDLKAYRDMLATVHGRMTELIKEGKNIDEIVAAKPTADYDAKWGGGFLKPDKWVKIVYSVMQK